MLFRSVSGTYTTTPAGDLQINPGPSTLVACGPDSQYQAFMTQLALAAKYGIAGPALRITLADEGTMTFQIGP